MRVLFDSGLLKDFENNFECYSTFSIENNSGKSIDCSYEGILELKDEIEYILAVIERYKNKEKLNGAMSIIK